ncbi:MAG: maleylpyruvate isomerase N-terminal domain-containing protein [Chloroflexota bacterium]
MDIVPDTKDWTWVLQRPCPECGFDTHAVQRESIPVMIRNTAGEFAVVLKGTADPQKRPSPEIWSPLEYACHVRDVFTLYHQRLQRMLTEDDPLFPNWDQDATAVEKRYREQDPARVSRDLLEEAEALAGRFEAVTGEMWHRPGRRSDGAQFTVETFARYMIHDPIHHVHDVTGRGSA